MTRRESKKKKKTKGRAIIRREKNRKKRKQIRICKYSREDNEKNGKESE